MTTRRHGSPVLQRRAGTASRTGDPLFQLTGLKLCMPGALLPSRVINRLFGKACPKSPSISGVLSAWRAPLPDPEYRLDAPAGSASKCQMPAPSSAALITPLRLSTAQPRPPAEHGHLAARWPCVITARREIHLSCAAMAAHTQWSIVQSAGHQPLQGDARASEAGRQQQWVRTRPAAER